MTDVQKPYDMITDYITGKAVPNIGAEENRQAVERFLVEGLGYPLEAVQVDRELLFDIDGESHQSLIDLVVSADGQSLMAIRCAAGSLDSWARGILAAARVAEDPPIPLAVVSDGRDAVIFESGSGRKIGEGCQSLPARDGAAEAFSRHGSGSLGKDQIRREQLIVRTYDADLVNVRRHLKK